MTGVPMDIPDTRYAKSDNLYIAYQVFGDGGINLVFVPGWTSHLDLWWDEPACACWFHRLGRFARVIIFDKRGTGLSDRIDRVPTMDERMDDIRAVMDATETTCAAIYGLSEGGSLAAIFAASHPQRCQALVLHGAFAKFSSWFPTEERLNAFLAYIGERWGSGANAVNMAPSRKGDSEFRAWWGRRERSSASPSAAIALMRINSQIDISAVLPSVQVPTLIIHRTNDRVVNVEGGRRLAELIPHSRLLEVPGEDHLPFIGGDVDLITDQIEEFLTGSKPVPLVERVLATVLFTDIVNSTERAEKLGDHRWRLLLDEHNHILRRELRRFRGNEVKLLGDGFLATFDGPARAVACSLSMIKAVRSLGLELRAGLHTGEVVFVDTDVSGVAVHIASRVAGQAGAGETLVSRTVKDLVAGVDLCFVSQGKFELRGITEPIELFSAAMGTATQ
jgi:pimeloyl-ACP methyl ester carboxylesterase/class 3 adenylate cyclase